MSVVHPLDLEGAAIFDCAQAGCQVCLEALLRRHEGLVHFVLHRQTRYGMTYDDLAQEGRIGLWQAVLCFHPERGGAFSTLAVRIIQHRMWRATALSKRQQRLLSLPRRADPMEAVEESWEQAAIHAALLEAVARLPDQLGEILVARYELDGQPRRTLKVIGQELGLTAERIRQLHDNALVFLRLPAYSAKLRYLCGEDSRAAYARSEALSRAWLEYRRQTRQRYERKQ